MKGPVTPSQPKAPTPAAPQPGVTSRTYAGPPRPERQPRTMKATRTIQAGPASLIGRGRRVPGLERIRQQVRLAPWTRIEPNYGLIRPDPASVSEAARLAYLRGHTDLENIPLRQMGYNPTFWEDPRRIARYWHAVQALPADRPLPDWLDRQALQQAYRYFEYRNGGTPWYTWRFLNVDDPARQWLGSMPMPPDGLLFPHERVFQQQGPGVQGFGEPEEFWPGYDELPWWQQLAVNMLGGRWGPVGGPAAMGAGIGGAIGLIAGGPAGLVGGAAVGAGLGGGVGGGIYGLQQYGQAHPEAEWVDPAISLVQDLLMAFDSGAELVERLGGTGMQVAYSVIDPERFGPLTEVLGNLPAAWDASTLYYTAAGGGAEFLPGGAEPGRSVWMLGEATPRDLPPELQAEWWATAGLAMTTARRMMVDGAGSEEAINAVAQHYGLSGQWRELLLHVTLDPLNLLFGAGATELIALAGRTQGNETLVAAAQMARQTGRTGLFGTMRTYGNILRRETGIEEVAHMGFLARYLGGVSEAGEARVLRPMGGVFDRLFGLTPKARAVEVMGIGSDGLRIMLDAIPAGGDRPLRAAELMRRVAESPVLVAEEMSLRFLNTPDGSLVPIMARDFVQGQLATLETVWRSTEGNRVALQRMAALVGYQNPNEFLAALQEANGPATMLQRMRQAAAQQVDNADAQGILRAIEAGQIDQRLLNDLVRVYLKEGAAWHPDHWMGQLYDAWMEHTSKWVVERLGVRVEGTVYRISQVLKAAQSLATLDLNPLYFVNNAVNNVVTMAYDRTFRMRSVRQALKWYEDFGLRPFRLRQAYGGPAGSGEGIASAFRTAREARTLDEMMRVAEHLASERIAKTARGQGLTATAERWINGVRRRVGLATKASSMVEEWSSVQAMTAGIQEWWSRAWRVGRGFERLPQEVERALGPELTRALYGTVEGSLNRRAMEQALFSQQRVRPGFESYVDDVAREMGMDSADVASILDSTGISDVLRNRLPQAQSQADIRSIFMDVENHVRAHIDNLAAQDYTTAIEHAAAQVQAGDWTGLLNTFYDLNRRYAEWWTQHILDWSATIDEAYTSTDASLRNQLIAARMLEANSAATRMTAFERAAYDGMLEGLRRSNLEPPRDFMAHLDDLHAARRSFYELRDKLWRDYFDTEFTTRDRRRARYSEIVSELDREYGRLAQRSLDLQEAMDEGIVRMVERYDDGLADRLRVWLTDMREKNAALFGAEQDVRRFSQWLLMEGPESGRGIARAARQHLANHPELLERMKPWLEELGAMRGRLNRDTLLAIRRRFYAEYLNGLKLPSISDYFRDRNDGLYGAITADLPPRPPPGAPPGQVPVPEVRPPGPPTEGQARMGGPTGLPEGVQQASMQAGITDDAIRQAAFQEGRIATASAAGNPMDSHLINWINSKRGLNLREEGAPIRQLGDLTEAQRGQVMDALQERGEYLRNLDAEAQRTGLTTEALQTLDRFRQGERVGDLKMRRLAVASGLDQTAARALSADQLADWMQSQREFRPFEGPLTQSAAQLYDRLLTFTGGDHLQANYTMQLVEANARVQGMTLDDYVAARFAFEPLAEGAWVDYIAQRPRDNDALHIAAERFFGLTDDPREAGYLLSDGGLLDFSGRAQGSGAVGQRMLDHSEIYASMPEGQGPASIAEFTSQTGAIRMSFNVDRDGALISLDIYRKPTLVQRRAVERMIASYQGRTDLVVDIWSPEVSRADDYRGIGTHLQGFERRGAGWEDLEDAWRMADRAFPERYYQRPADAVQNADFRAWFEGSQVVDEAGLPMIVYHGTGRPGFTEFDPSRADLHALWGRGFYFTSDPQVAGGVYERVSRWTYHATREAAEAQPGRISFVWNDDTTGQWIAPVGEYVLRKPGYAHRVGDQAIQPQIAAQSAEALRGTAAWQRLVELERPILTSTEREFLVRVLGDFERTGDLGLLNILRDQPYNLTEEIARLGIEPVGAVYPVYLRIRNPINVDHLLDAQSLQAIREAAARFDWERARYAVDMPERLERLLASRAQRGEEVYGRDIWRFFDEHAGSSPDFSPTTEFFRSMGYDGVEYAGGVRTGSEIRHRAFVAFEPTQVKSIHNLGTFDPTNPNILFQGGGTVLPFYSHLARVVEGKMPGRMTVQELRSFLRGAGVRQDEIVWSGLEDVLARNPGSITREEVLDTLAANPVQPRVIEYPSPTRIGVEGWTGSWEFNRMAAGEYWADVNKGILSDGSTAWYRAIAWGGADGSFLVTLDSQDAGITARRTFQSIEEVQQWLTSPGTFEGTIGSRYSSYTIPYGTNYREWLLTLPESERWGYPPGRHWTERNVVVHLRTTDRLLDDGRRMLLLEEVQSDWMQELRGRRPALRDLRAAEAELATHPATRQLWAELGDTVDRINRTLAAEGIGVGYEVLRDRASNLRGQLSRAAPPGVWEMWVEATLALQDGGVAAREGPWSETWHELAMRYALHRAVSEGYDAIGWTTGRQQVARYTDATMLDMVRWTRRGDRYWVDGTLGDNWQRLLANASEDQLAETVGRAMARKIVEGPDVGEAPMTYGGLGDFYDQTLTGWARRWGKRFGALVEDVRLQAEIGPEEGGSIVHHLPITPSMRDSVMDGLPLFQRTQLQRILARQAAETRVADALAELTGLYRELGVPEDLARGLVQREATIGRATPRTAAEAWELAVVRTREHMLRENLAEARRAVLDTFGESGTEAPLPRGMTAFLEDGRAIIQALQNPNVSTAVHELAHVMRRQLTGDQMDRVTRWLRESHSLEVEHLDGRFVAQEPVVRQAEELFARGFEQYLAEGVAPVAYLADVFAAFKRWLLEVYHAITGSEIDVRISDDMRRLFDEMLSQDAEAARRLETDFNFRRAQRAAPGPGAAAAPAGGMEAWVNARRAALAEAEAVPDAAQRVEAIQRLQQAFDQARDPTWLTTDGDIEQALARAFADLRSQQELPGLVGRQTLAYGPDPNQAFELRYAVVELDDLVASNTPTFEVNPRYPQELQPRDRTRAVNRTQVEGMVANLNPEALLRDTSRIDDGTPIIWRDQVVESGNGRVLALSLARRDRPEAWQAYQELLRRAAQEYGINADELATMEAPVLVRERLTDIARQEFVRLANDSPAARMGFTESVLSDAARLTDTLLSGLDVADEQSVYEALDHPRNAGFVRGYMELVPRGEWGDMVDAAGALNRRGKDRIIGAMFAATYPGEAGQRLVAALFESGDSGVRRIGDALTGSLGPMARVEALIRAGRRPAELSLGDDLAAAVDVLRRLRQQRVSVQDYVQQSTMFGRELTDFQEVLLLYLSDLRGGKQLREALTEYARLVDAQPEIGQTGMFGAVEYPSRVELWARAQEPAQQVLFQLPEGARPGPFDATPNPLYLSNAHEDMYQHVKPILDRLRARMEGDDRAWTGFNQEEINTRLTPDQQQAVRDWSGRVAGQMADTKFAAVGWGERMRDLGLLNYNARIGGDNVSVVGMPYVFWPSRTVLNWATRTFDRPSMMANFARLLHFQQQQQGAAGYPQRLEGRVRIPIPWLPDWMGDGLYIDPWHQLYPPSMFIDAWLRIAQAEQNEARRADGMIRRWIESNQVSRHEAMAALETRAGPLWEAALTEARMQNEAEFRDPFDYLSLLSGWSYPIEVARQVIAGTPERINPLPVTRAIKTLTAGLGLNEGAGWNIEGPFRRLANIPEWDRFEDYRVRRMLANMVGDGELDPRSAMLAMVEQQGEAYTEAVRRVNQARLYGTFLNPLYWLGFPADSFPSGEQAQRALGQRFEVALDNWRAGNPDAITEFLDEFPEYRARMAAMDDPEETLRRLLIDDVWLRYRALGSANKEQARLQLGQTFQDGFLSRETRSYDSIPTEMLATWVRILGGMAPEGAATRMYETPLPENVEAIRVLNPELAQAVDDFRAERTRLHPNWFALQQEYFRLPSGEQRRQFVARFPELEAYWDWRRDYLRRDERVRLYSERFDIETSRSERVGSLSMAQVLADPVLSQQLLGMHVVGQPLTNGAVEELYRIWQQTGEGQDFNEWVRALAVAAGGGALTGP